MKRAVILIASVLLSTRGATGAEVVPQRVRVRALPAGASRSAPDRRVPAAVLAGQRATISTRMSAAVAAVAVDEGARVRKGQVLVTLSDADLRAQLQAAEVALEKAALHQRRIEALIADRAAVPAELDLAIAQRAQAQAAVDVVRTALRYTSLRAPFDARVQARRVSAGDLVGPGQPLIELEGGGFELQATLSQEEAVVLREGLQIRFQAEGREGAAEVFAISAGADPIARRQLIRARIVDPPPGLRTGAFARLTLPGDTREALWVPRAVLVERGDLTGVFVARDGRAELRWLALGEAEGDRIPVRAGLRAGELVIEDPGAVADGAPVEVAHAR
jgi:RND family efflux transporter MFP subunit